jgi:hypothetical protein
VENLGLAGTPASLPIFGSYKKSLLRHGTLSEHGFGLLSNG